jgi:hypothetical protein
MWGYKISLTCDRGNQSAQLSTSSAKEKNKYFLFFSLVEYPAFVCDVFPLSARSKMAFKTSTPFPQMEIKDARIN